MNKNKNEISGYFTEDVRTVINEMSAKTMKELLIELEGTPAWFAILKYTQERVFAIQESFLTLDPVKEPSSISRYQGAITGMLDLQDAILSLKFEAKKVEDPKYQKEKSKDELGGAYSA